MRPIPLKPKPESLIQRRDLSSRLTEEEPVVLVLQRIISSRRGVISRLVLQRMICRLAWQKGDLSSRLA
jgi:hypothetical protein